MADQTIVDVTALAGKLRYTVSDMGCALALEEQLRVVRVGVPVSNPVLSEKEKRRYSDDLGPLARMIKGDVGIGMATKSATARPYCPGEVAVLFALFHIAAFQDDIIDYFLLSKRTEAALTELVRTMIRQIEKLGKK